MAVEFPNKAPNTHLPMIGNLRGTHFASLHRQLQERYVFKQNNNTMTVRWHDIQQFVRYEHGNCMDGAILKYNRNPLNKNLKFTAAAWFGSSLVWKLNENALENVVEMSGKWSKYSL